MYTIKVESNGVLTTTVADALIKGNMNLNPMHILVPQVYDNGYCKKFDMSKFDASLIFVLPGDDISNTKTIRLIRNPELYKERFVEYQLPQNTEFVSRAGIVACKLVFQYTDMEHNVEYFRDTFPIEIMIEDTSLESMYKSEDEESIGRNTSNKGDAISLGGLKSINGEVFIVDKNGNKIGDAISIEKTYLDNTVASNLQVTMI